MGSRKQAQAALSYEFNLEARVPADHLLRSIDRLVDLADIRTFLQPFCSDIGRPLIDPELMIQALLAGYIVGIRSERGLWEEAHLNLAYRWFCRLDVGAPCRIKGVNALRAPQWHPEAHPSGSAGT